MSNKPFTVWVLKRKSDSILDTVCDDSIFKTKKDAKKYFDTYVMEPDAFEIIKIKITPTKA